MDSIFALFTEPHQYTAAAGVAIALIGAGWALFRKGKGRSVTMKPRDNSSTVVLFSLPRWDYGPNPSPGCLKLETFLRLAKIPYKYHLGAQTGPTERWPYISHKGQYICDSNTIMDYLLKEVPSALCGDEKLTPRDKALGDIITRMLEDASYFGLVRSRWVDNFDPYMTSFRFPGPNFVKKLVFGKLRKDLIKTLNSQGCGDRTDEEYYGDLLKDVQSLEQWLPSQPGKFFGNVDVPTRYDATIWSYLSSLLVFPYHLGNKSHTNGKLPPHVEFMKNSEKIMKYLQFVESKAFPDMKEVCMETKNCVLYKALP